MVKWCALWTVVLMLLIPPGAGAKGGPEEGLPFSTGEKLSYAIRWGMIKVGEATLTVQDGSEEMGRAAFRFEFNARSTGMFAFVHDVDIRVVSYTDRSVTRSLLYLKEEGGQEDPSSKRVRFDWKHNVAVRFVRDRREGVVLLPDNVLDPLSMYYSFRTENPAVGKTTTHRVCDGYKIATPSATAQTREKIHVVPGRFDTFKLVQDQKGLESIFPHAQGAPVLIWTTTSDTRIPVRMKSKTRFGTLTVELSSMEGVDFP